MKKGGAVLLLAVLIVMQVKAQSKRHFEMMKPGQPAVCYADPHDKNTYIASPLKFNAAGRTKTATFEVTYVNFSSEAQSAFQAAVDIWSTLISSDVPIRITATWESLSAGVLGSASAGTFIRNFAGAQRQQTWYPVALAEKITGVEINGAGSPDIVASFNSSNSAWFYGTGGGAPTGTYDLVSIVLHEIGHGLGINHNYTVSGTNGLISNGDYVFTYATYLENLSAQNIVTAFTQPSADLRTQLISTNLFFNSPSVLTSNAGARAKIYAPATFTAGSSIAHLDETTYPAGNPNSLMTPQIGLRETIHDPGAIAMAMLNDMGWTRILVKHTPLSNTETLNAPYVVKGVIQGDKSYNASTVKLHYTTNGTSFTDVNMTPTGNANEFSGNLPSSATTITYGYYISVEDNAQFPYTLPGMIYLQGNAPKQSLIAFTAGPDTKAPKIVHDAKQFLVDTDTQLVLNAIVSDNIGIQSVNVEYQINGVAKPDITMTLKVPADSLYEATITFSPLLSQNDVVKYRIRAIDSSVAHNQTVTPASNYFEVPVTGLLPVQTSYANNFNTASSDFFGDNLFSVQMPSGFNNGAIHTSHPYPNGTGANNESNSVYQLKVPVKLKATNAFVRFDEIVLVEPSDAGAAFGSSGFYDYVVVEGSKDGGTTWKNLLDGYNSRSQTDWLARFNSASDSEAQPNSTATGIPSLFKSREIDLLAAGNFAAGDEVIIRFRLFADQLVHGWGWAIDNLRIQVDETPPVVLHDHLNYQLKGNDQFTMAVNATDGDALASLAIEYQINSEAINTYNFPVAENTSNYTLNQVVTGLNKGDVFKYRVRAKDPTGNESVLPATDFFTVPVIEFNAAATQYVSDFNASNTDFVGNFFTISQPAAFNNGLINTTHPYPNGFGLNKTSDFIYLLKTPIIVSDTNPFMSFDEEVITESVATEYVTVEGSKDNGVTWETLIANYNASANANWVSAFTNAQNGTAALLKNRLINITGTGKFKAGDKVLIRFRFTSNATANGWGWAIDNVSIQGPITGLESATLSDVLVYPNPVENGKVSLEVTSAQPASFHLSFFNAQGKLMNTETMDVNETVAKKEVETNWPAGLYILKIETGGKVISRKIIVR
jgi:hypothetical protein